MIRYRRERWLTPEGVTVVAPLPPGTQGHFGPELRRFVLALYHQGQSTVQRITTVLADIGMDISRRQVQRLLTGQQDFLAEDRAVLQAGLATAAWISVDDTGARHGARHGDRHGARNVGQALPRRRARARGGRKDNSRWRLHPRPRRPPRPAPRCWCWWRSASATC